MNFKDQTISNKLETLFSSIFKTQPYVHLDTQVNRYIVKINNQQEERIYIFEVDYNENLLLYAKNRRYILGNLKNMYQLTYVFKIFFKSNVELDLHESNATLSNIVGMGEVSFTSDIPQILNLNPNDDMVQNRLLDYKEWNLIFNNHLQNKD